MIKRFALSLLIIMPCVIFQATAATELSNYKADVRVIRHGAVDIKAKGTTSFTINDNNDWSIQLSVKGGGLKSEESSKGFFDNGLFKPQTYRKRTKFLLFKEYVDWTFDWANQRVKGKVKKNSYEHATGQSLHDPLSYQVALRRAVSEGQSSMEYQYLRYNRPQKLTFEVIGEELLSIDGGRVHTLIIKETAPLARVDKSLIWIAKDFDYIPVRFASYKDDKIKDEIKINRLWINGKEVDFSSAE